MGSISQQWVSGRKAKTALLQRKACYVGRGHVIDGNDCPQGWNSDPTIGYSNDTRLVALTPL